MRVKLTLRRPDGSADDLVVTADASATIGDIAETIERVDPFGGRRRSLDAPPLTLVPLATEGPAGSPGPPAPHPLSPSTPLGDAPLGSGAVVALGAPVDRAIGSGLAAGPSVTVRVLGGPDAGLERTLSGGTMVIGRDASCDLVLADPLVSKRHARIVAGTVVELVDLGSANGVVIDDGIVPRLTITGRQTVVIGGTELELTVLPGSTAAQSGPVAFNRSPRVEARYAGSEFPAPEVPKHEDPPMFPLIAMFAPVMMGIGLFAISGQVRSLLFVAMTPLMLIGNFYSDRIGRRRKLRRRIAEFDSRLAALGERLETEKRIEHAVRLAEAPSTAEVLEGAVGRRSGLWTRRPEHWSFLNLRLALGSMATRNSIAERDDRNSLPEYQERFDAMLAQHRLVADVPVIDNLYDAGALGVAGAPRLVADATNALLIQVTGLHSPAEVVVASLVTPAWSSAFQWLKWLPHTSSPQSPLEGSHLADSASSALALLASLEELIEDRLAAARTKEVRRGAASETDAALLRGAEVGEQRTGEGTKAQIPAVVVLVSDDLGLDRSRLVQLAERGADAGVFPIWLADEVPALPAVCRTYLEVLDESGAAVVGLVRLGETVTDARTDLVPSARALGFARSLAPVVDAGALVEDASDLPRSVSLVTLLGHELVESSSAVIDRWRQNASVHDRTPGIVPRTRKAGTLRATVGSAGADPMHLDLRTQGPHALVGGTTGAGKSEFLQAWVLGMAAEYSPDRVTFLFVDYKGGSAFADCVALPHCVGLVTDLSPHLVRRALTSLRAELHHREHLLNRKKAKDLLELEKRGDPDSPPALVLVIDEFAALVGEVPAFVDGVVDIAQRGRSLGIHLIMATQRPAGVIRDNLRANTNLRVALRMADESDSQDVVGVQDAAHVDPGLPGRGIAKTGPGRLSPFQSAYAGGWTSREPDRQGIDVAELRFGSERRWEEPASDIVEEIADLGPTDQQRLVARIVEATTMAEIPPARRPWLDELAPAYDLGKLRQRTDAELVLGVVDLPLQQAQRVVHFQPDVDGHVAVYGTGGSGKSAALRTLAAAAGITPRGGPVQVYGLDFGAGSLRMLEAMPHVGSIIAGDDAERIVRLFRMLKGIMDDRRPRFAAADASTITDYRRLTGRQSEPRILLLVDGFPAFRADWEISAGRSAWFDVFKDILSDGRQLGLHVVLTADRSSAVPSSIASAVQRRVVLRLADETGYSQLDVPNDILGPSSAAGRAIIDGSEAQIAILGGSPSVSEQATATRSLAESMRRAGLPEAPPIGSLPTEYPESDLPERWRDTPVLGIGEAELGPTGFDPVGVLLLAGGPASGRTTALGWLSRSLLRFDPEFRLYYLGNARSPVGAGEGWTGVARTVEEVAALAKSLVEAVRDDDTEGRIGVVVESLNDFLQTPADAAIVELTKAIKRSDHLLIAEAETSAWGSSWPLMSEIKNGRRGLLLQPDSIEGDLLLKTALPRMARSEFPPGRGVFIAKGRHARVHLPLPE